VLGGEQVVKPEKGELLLKTVAGHLIEKGDRRVGFQELDDL